MNAEILAVGTELLLGDILNTNAQFLSRELAGLGVSVYFQSVVGDNPDRLRAALKTAFDRSDIVITTGGLGPTKDDLTKEIGADYFGRKLVVDEESMAVLEGFFAKSGRKMTENNRKQAYLPEGAKALPNNNGTAPGCIIEDKEKNKTLIMLPGPPSEAKPMFYESVAPYLKAGGEQMKFVSKTLRICGVGESLAEEMVKDLIENQVNPTIAPYAKVSELTFRITAAVKDEGEAEALMAPVVGEMYKRFGENIYGEGETTLEETVAKQLLVKGLKIAVAESCTGGLLTGRLVDYPGISQVLLEGAVTYTNDAKINRLGVLPETLAEFGAVSPETAAEMAKGIALRAGADVGVSTTGVAGPSGGTEEKPVGLVYLGFYYKGKTKTTKLNLSGNRQKIRNRAVVNALDMIRRELNHDN